MNIFDELGSQYFEIDNNYSLLEFQAASKGWSKKEAVFRRKRELNDQAYFLFMFSRLEDRIKQLSSTTIISKKASINSWIARAAWDILPSSPKNGLDFKKHLALLVDKNCANYKLISDYYAERNSIAHGGNFTSPISIPTVISELKRMYKIIKAN